MAEIPKYLDNYLFNELQAEYAPGYPNLEDLNVDFNLNNTDKGNKIYLGTYFPRSWVESFQIFNEIFSNQIIRQKFSNRKAINILDIGAGTGGNLMGLLESLKLNNFLEKKINVITVEGNKIAIDYQKKVVNLFKESNKTEINLITVNKIINNETIGSLFSLFKEKKVFFDIVMSFKFVSEFYNDRATIQNALQIKYFKLLTEYVSEILLPTGIFLLLDLCSKNFERPTFRDFTPIIMTKEIKEFVKSSSNISFLLPITCALWSGTCNTYNCYTERVFAVKHSRRFKEELSKVTYKVFASPVFANEIISSINKKNKYQTCYGKIPQCCQNGYLSEIQDETDLSNGFKLD